MADKPAQIPDYISEYQEKLKLYLTGKLDQIVFTGLRVYLGIYEQRATNTFMVRIRCTGGYISPAQLNKVAEIALRYEAGHIHLTTRQEMQMVNVRLEDTSSILEELFHCGLSTYGSGGNSIRNIVASADSGINIRELFDVFPYALAVNQYLQKHNKNINLPRKFKIAFSSDKQDSACAIFNDLGFVAKIENGQKGFRVFLGGSLGAKAMKGHLLYDFIPTDQVLRIIIAALNMFSKYGNRKNKHTSRLRHLFHKFGSNTVLEWFFSTYKNTPTIPFDIKNQQSDNQLNLSGFSKDNSHSNEYVLWKKRYAKAQIQEGYYSVLMPINRGNIKPDLLQGIATYLMSFDDKCIRFTQQQNILLRNIPRSRLNDLYKKMKQLRLSIQSPLFLNSITSCTGANVCRLGISNAPGLTDAIKNKLQNSNIDLDLLEGLRINISGCPNSCGKHQISDIGFQGKVGRNNEVYPAYKIFTTKKDNGVLELGIAVNELPAKKIPEFIEALLVSYQQTSSAGKTSFNTYLNNQGKKDIQKICKNLSMGKKEDNYYFDWESSGPFSVLERLEGQCSAGLFDLIEYDQAIIQKEKELIHKLRKTGDLNYKPDNLLFSACRMLLITRGSAPIEKEDVFKEFVRLFIHSGLVPKEFIPLIDKASKNELDKNQDTTDKSIELADKVILLYEQMDDSLQFITSGKKEPDASEPEIPEKDYKGVACPMNFVKIKIDLSQIQPGGRLKVLLDDGEPIENVPASLKSEGHKIIEQIRQKNYWVLIIEKKSY